MQTVEKLPGIVFAGVTTYPGHIWSLPAEQAAPLSEVSSKVEQVLESLQKVGIASEITDRAYVMAVGSIVHEIGAGEWSSFLGDERQRSVAKDVWDAREARYRS